MDFLPGFLQGITRVIISHPFDYVRVYLQSNKSTSVKHFFAKNSVTSLYRGVAIPLITVPIDRAIQLKAYEHFNKQMNPFFSGCFCGIISSFFTLPSSFICNNYVLNKNEKSLLTFTKGIFNNNSLKIFYRGYKPEIARSILSTSIYLGVYGNMRKKFGNTNLQCAINSAVAGISVWTVAYPFETIKLEQQISNKRISSILLSRIRTYGVMNLWKGISPLYIRTIPSSIIGMMVYEKVRKIIEK
jgi:hypothetical protein